VLYQLSYAHHDHYMASLAE